MLHLEENLMYYYHILRLCDLYFIAHRFSIFGQKNNESYPLDFLNKRSIPHVCLHEYGIEFLANKKPYNTSFTLVFKNYRQHISGVICQ